MSFFFQKPDFASECVQGLSGPLFAIKIICFINEWYRKRSTFRLFSIPPPSLMFEIGELMILLERRTFCYHLSGILVGLIYSAISHKWFKKTFPGMGIRLGGLRNNRITNANQQRTTEPWTRSWGYGLARFQPITRKSKTQVEAPHQSAEASLQSCDQSDSPTSSISERSQSSEGNINEIPAQNSQSPPTFTIGGERTDERDITMSPSINSPQSEMTFAQHVEVSGTDISESENVSFERSNFRPEPSYFSETSPPKVPVGLGGGTVLEEESPSEEEEEGDDDNDDEDENQNYSSEASEGEANQDISDNIGTQANHSPPTDGPPTIPFDNAVLNMDDLRQRRIERFS